jgi:hypothetical protein
VGAGVWPYMCRFSSKDFALQACNRFSWRSRQVSLVRRSNRRNARAPTIQYWFFQENRGKTQSRNGHLAPTSPRGSTTPQRGRPGVDPLILRQRRLGSRGYPLGKPILRGLVRWEEVRVGSGVLKVLRAFWDKLEGSCRRPQTGPPRIWRQSYGRLACPTGCEGAKLLENFGIGWRIFPDVKISAL